MNGSEIFIAKNWVNFHFTTVELEIMIDLGSDSTLKMSFKDENNIASFWLRVKDDFLTWAKKALEILLPFVKSYLCDTGFYAVAISKM